MKKSLLFLCVFLGGTISYANEIFVKLSNKIFVATLQNETEVGKSLSPNQINDLLRGSDFREVKLDPKNKYLQNILRSGTWTEVSAKSAHGPCQDESGN